MENLSVILFDSDAEYARRLASVLKTLLGPAVIVRTQREESGRKAEDCVRIRMVKRQKEQEEVIWEEEIYKYQPVSGIAGRIKEQFPPEQKRKYYVRTESSQLWYGVYSPCLHESTVPFLCTLAGKLGEKRKVLVIVLAQFCGISRLLGLEGGSDTERLFLELRRCGEKEISSVRIPQPVALHGFDLLTAPENPEVLFELEGQDIRRLIARLEDSGYGAVVWLAEEMVQGIEYLIARSRYLLCPDKKDTGSACRREEFEAFCRKLPVDGLVKKIRYLTLPVFAQMECGEHLLWQWKESALRMEAEKWVEEDGDRMGRDPEEDSGASGQHV